MQTTYRRAALLTLQFGVGEQGEIAGEAKALRCNYLLEDQPEHPFHDGMGQRQNFQDQAGVWS